MSDWLDADMRAAVDKLQEWQQAGLVAYGEARSEPIQGVVAVCRTFVNRVNAKSWFGKTVSEVVLKPHQYSCLHPSGGPKNYERVLSLAGRLAGGESVTDQKWLKCAWAARGVIGGFIVDADVDKHFSDCTHYHTATLQPRPLWAQKVTPAVQIAGHVFYRGVK